MKLVIWTITSPQTALSSTPTQITGVCSSNVCVQSAIKNLIELGFDKERLLSNSYYADVDKRRVYSVLRPNEINELLHHMEPFG